MKRPISVILNTASYDPCFRVAINGRELVTVEVTGNLAELTWKPPDICWSAIGFTSVDYATDFAAAVLVAIRVARQLEYICVPGNSIDDNCRKRDKTALAKRLAKTYPPIKQKRKRK